MIAPIWILLASAPLSDAAPSFLDPTAEALTAALSPLQEEAEAEADEEPPPSFLGFDWNGGITAGLTVSRGNTVSHTATLSVNAEGNAEQSRLTVGASYIGGRNQNRDRSDPEFRETQTTARSTTGEIKYDYFLSEERRSYLYAKGLAQTDGVRDLDLLWQVGVGVGRLWWDAEQHKFLWLGDRQQTFETEIGVTYTEEDFKEPTQPPPPAPMIESSDAEYVGARAAVRYQVELSETASAYTQVEWLPSLEDFQENQLYRTKSGLRTQISGNLNAEMAVLFNYDTSPAPGFGRRDIIYIFGLNWSF